MSLNHIVSIFINMPIYNQESQISKLPIKVQVKLAQAILKDGTFEWEYPLDDTDDNLDVLESYRVFGLYSVTPLDVSYIALFIQNNKEKIENNISEGLEVPTFKKYDIFYRFTEYKKEYQEWGDVVGSYSEKFVRDIVDYEWITSSDWTPYDGVQLDYESELEEFDNDSFEIWKVKEENKNINESVYKTNKVKKVSDLIKGMDKQSLLKLKKIIDSKLKIS